MVELPLLTSRQFRLRPRLAPLIPTFVDGDAYAVSDVYTNPDPRDTDVDEEAMRSWQSPDMSHSGSRKMFSPWRHHSRGAQLYHNQYERRRLA